MREEASRAEKLMLGRLQFFVEKTKKKKHTQRTNMKKNYYTNRDRGDRGSTGAIAACQTTYTEVVAHEKSPYLAAGFKVITVTTPKQSNSGGNRTQGRVQP